MSLKFFGPLLLITFAAVGIGKEEGLSSDVRKQAPVIDSDPVTCAEANETMQRVEDAMTKLYPSVHAGTPSVAAGTTPVKRAQVIDEFDRVSKLFIDVYTLKPREQYCDPDQVRLPAKERGKAIRLIKLGFVEPVAQLAIGPSETLTPQEYSEALGFFVERWADMTHLPSTKFSPDMMPDPLKQTQPAVSPVPVRPNASLLQPLK